MTDKEVVEKATARPWSDPEIDTCEACRRDGTAEWDIPEVYGGNHGMFAEEADARLIVLAVNSYEESAATIRSLVEALEFAKEIIADQAKRFHQDCRCQLCESLPIKIDAALAQARRGKP